MGLLIAHVIPAPVGVTDQTGGVGHQDQALGIVQDLAGEIALALQFGLKGLQAADIQHDAAVLHHALLGIAHGEGINQDLDGGPVLAAQSYMELQTIQRPNSLQEWWTSVLC